MITSYLGNEQQKAVVASILASSESDFVISTVASLESNVSSDIASSESCLILIIGASIESSFYLDQPRSESS